jgi:hypothetical protein
MQVTIGGGDDNFLAAQRQEYGRNYQVLFRVDAEF